MRHPTGSSLTTSSTVTAWNIEKPFAYDKETRWSDRMKRISIDPITRLEGHGRIDIFLNDEGNVDNAYLIIPELRGFEQFCVGRPAEEMPRITNRICGVCPEAHHMAATKALDALFHVEPSSAVKKLREMFYMAFYVTDHTTHFYALGGPDFVLGPDAPPAERNILGVVHKVGVEIGKQVIDTRMRNHDVIKMLGGRGVHPVAGLPGGWSQAVTAEMRQEIEDVARKNVEFGLFSLKLFDDVVLSNQQYVDLIVSDAYTERTYYMGTVDENNRVNFYDGHDSGGRSGGQGVRQVPCSRLCHSTSPNMSSPGPI